MAERRRAAQPEESGEIEFEVGNRVVFTPAENDKEDLRDWDGATATIVVDNHSPVYPFVIQKPSGPRMSARKEELSLAPALA